MRVQESAHHASVFISYRRDDTEGQAGRLFQALRDAFGDDAV